MTERETIEVTAATWSDGERLMGPDGEQTSEPVRILTLTFAQGGAALVRGEWGNVLSALARPDRPLLRMESLECQYSYDHEHRVWWASRLSVETVHCDDSGQALTPLKKQILGAWGEDAPTTPGWAQDLVAAYRPSPTPAPLA